MESPASSFNSIRRYSTSVILASVFGQRATSYATPKVQALYHAQEQFTEILAPGATPPVDAFPVLRYIPAFLAGYKSRAARIRREQRTLYSSLLDETQARRDRLDIIPCFMNKLLENKEKSGLNSDQLIYTGGILMEAGSDTTSATLHSFILAMIKYPLVLQKAQKELDEICGTSRSPGASDIGKATYVQAIMTEDDTYDGYLLPKGTIVFANTWSIHQDAAEYENPEEFIPERFLENKYGSKNTQEDSADNDQRRVTYGFGAGRRMINMAKIAWAFSITADPNSPPLDVEVCTGYSDGFVLGPKPFSASFQVRSSQHREVIDREFESVKAFFRKYED
ncbi:hypothetical protein LTR84_008275 [Exophiala bonariae]|uniref:Cytochrome P450 n=1 Tax=Exophiala bonariae TaxID=1690606 RepID=A0AAV9MYU9_9EURO|nr:hypothetical protein LTR84_008275 [Exophiala bonariae]